MFFRPRLCHPFPMAKPASSPADQAEEFARRYELELDQYVALRMEELGIPEHPHGAPEFGGDGQWRAFITRDRVGGRITIGITVNSGCLNPELLQGMSGEEVFAKARLRDRIDAIIAHECEEDRSGIHEGALRAAPQTELPISDEARRILRSMPR